MSQYKTSDQDEVIDIVEGILDAKNKSQFLAEKLKLPKHITDEIHKKQHSEALEWLYEVIHEFVNRLKPRLTWRLIILALRSPLIHLPLLAKRWRGNTVLHPKHQMV